VSRASNRANGDIFRDFLSIADLVEEPLLAQLYAYLDRREDLEFDTSGHGAT